MTQLVKYEAARHALQVAHSVDEVKDIRDKAQAMAAYAKQANDTELVEWATEIKVRAERRAGELTREIDSAQGRRSTSSPNAKKSKGEVLADLGVSPQTAHRWEKLAAVPEEQFEQAVAAAKEVAGEVTTAAMLRLRDKPESKPKPSPKPSPLEAKNAALEEEIAALKENLPELTAMASAAEALKNDEHFTKIVHLEAELASVKKRRDELMRENVELKRQVKWWKSKAEKKAA